MSISPPVLALILLLALLLGEYMRPMRQLGRRLRRRKPVAPRKAKS